MMEEIEKLIFAPLIRVSTERQERQGESLNWKCENHGTPFLRAGRMGV